MELDINTYFVEEEIHEVVKVPPAFIGKNVSSKVLEILKQTYEDKCSKYGYIRHGSVDIVKIGGAQVELHSLCGFINVYVIFTAQALNPPEKSFLRTQVRNINKFGILTAVQLDGKDVMQIIIPKQIALMKSSVNLDRIHIGEKVTVEIVKRRIEVGENVLYGIGRIVAEESHIEEFEAEEDPAVQILKPDEDELLMVDDEDPEEELVVEDEPDDIMVADEEDDVDVDDDGLSEVFSVEEDNDEEVDAE